MRSPRLVATLTALIVVAAACSGGDDTIGDADGSSVPSVAPTTTIVVPVAPDECDDEPDPADYVDGEVPNAIRPCAVPDELVVHTIREGTGDPARAGDGVIYHYTRVRAADGALVDSSYTDGLPVNLPGVGQGAEIEGLDSSLVGVRAGDLLRIDIPADLAYGDEPPAIGGDGIRAGDALTYVVDVRGVIPVVEPDDAPLDLRVEPSVGATEVTTVDLVEGTGRPAAIGTTVVLNLLLVRGDNSVVIFNSWDEGSPLVIPIDPARMTGDTQATLPGIFDGIQGAMPGTRRIITIPPEDAWGPEGQPQLGLPADTDVIVVADVLAVY